MQRNAFKMNLLPGFADEYRRRHDEIWPELSKTLRDAGVTDYSIFLDGETKIHVAGTIWHRTGDAGWIDCEKRIWLLGRAAEKLPPFISPACLPDDALCYPFAIECALREAFSQIRTAALKRHQDLRRRPSPAIACYSEGWAGLKAGSPASGGRVAFHSVMAELRRVATSGKSATRFSDSEGSPMMS